MSDTNTTAQGEGVIDAQYDPADDGYGASEMSVHLQALREVLVDALPGARSSEHRGELTVHIRPDDLVHALTFCKDDSRVACELLSDLSAVHWPGGVIQENDQTTTGWPTFVEEVEEGRMEVDYLLRSIEKNHWFRLRVTLPDEDMQIPSATGHYAAANFMEREVFDMMGVEFIGHPSLTRILMPEDWDGHPHRKDYPLGGVEVMYKGETIPPPDERDY